MRKAMLAAVAASAAMLGLAVVASAAEVRLMTGPQAGFWVPLGGQLKDVWEKSIPDFKVQSLPGAGIANVRAIEEGKAEIGFGNTITTADAVAGTGEAPLDKKHAKVCNVATLYPQYFQVVVNADCRHQLAEGPQGQGLRHSGEGQHRRADRAPCAARVGHDLQRRQGELHQQLHRQCRADEGQPHAHAFALGTGIPASSLMDLASARDIRLIDMAGIYEEMRKINPAYKLVTIPKGTYPKQDKDVQVIGYYTHVVAACSLPEDTVYKMTAATLAAKESMSSVYKELGKLTPQVMAQEIGVPFHPGAAKWYKEQGITVN